MSELVALAERVEREPAGGKLWREVFAMHFPEPSPKYTGAQLTADWLAWNDRQAAFTSWLLSGAYLDAADMLADRLRSIGWRFDIAQWRDGTFEVEGHTGDTLDVVSRVAGHHAEARARLAAALRARAAAGGGR